jgi:hypothetical protein
MFKWTPNIPGQRHGVKQLAANGLDVPSDTKPA